MKQSIDRTIHWPLYTWPKLATKHLPLRVFIDLSQTIYETPTYIRFVSR